VIRLTLYGLSLIAIVGCQSTGNGDVVLPAPPGSPIFDTLIVPGQRIGPISIGMTAGELLRVAGAPTNSTRFKDGSANRFGNGIGAFVADDSGRVFSVNTADPRYRTVGGVGTNSSDLEIRSNFGAPVRSIRRDWRVVCYNGIAFHFEQSESATGVEVRPPNSIGCR
jgi:hypothetical protein